MLESPKIILRAIGSPGMVFSKRAACLDRYFMNLILAVVWLHITE